MAKKNKAETVQQEVLETKVNPTISAEEHAKLIARIAELEAKEAKRASTSPDSAKYYNELQKIKDKGKSGLNTIKYKEVDDHKNIPMYMTNGLRIGKMVGPLHPMNAERAFGDFLRLGILLSLTPPTPQQVAEYKETTEYKKLRAEYSDLRKLRQRSKTQSGIEKLTEQISRMLPAGEKVIDIKSPDQVVATSRR